MLSIDFHSRLDEEQLPSFTLRLTPWQTWLTQSMWVTDSRMLCSLPRFCEMHPVDRFVSEGWFSSDQVIFLWSPYGIRQTIIFSSCGFFLSSFFPRLISAAAHWMSTILPHMVWP